MTSFFKDIYDDNVYKFFSGGKWIKSHTGNLVDINSPIDNSLVGRIQAMAKDEIDQVFFHAKEAQKKWVSFALEDRAAVLKRAAELLRDNAEDVLEKKVLEIAKCKEIAKFSILRSADTISYVADQLDIVNKQEILYSKDFPNGGDRKTASVSREPVGVVLAISPFNYPINLVVTKIAPALLAGNSVVIKGPTQGSITTAMLVEIFNKAGVIPGAINFVSGRGSEIGDYLVSHKDADMINFTGSSAVGKDIAKKAGAKPLLLELGGKDAALVLDDADLDLAASEITEGAFSYAGQRCTAIKRVLAHKDIHDELIKKIVLQTREKYSILGDPRDEKTQLNPLISEKQGEYAGELIDDALQCGAKVLAGGVINKNYMQATVLDNVNEKMRIAWEEQFAPILPIIICEDEEEMIRIHNKSEYGLGGSIFSQDLNKAKELAEKLQIGVIQINRRSERFPDNFPFLGIKNSGLGIQGVRWSIEAMTRVKNIVENK